MITRHLGRLLGLAADRALNQLWPLEAHTRAYLATLRVADKAAEDLADAEAAVEVTEPELEPWEQELRDACAIDDCAEAPDDLWAAEQRARTIHDLPTDQTIDEWLRSLNLPADREHGAATPPVAPSQRTVDVGRPAGAVVTPTASASGAGGTHTIPVGEVAAVIAVIMRRHGINSAPIYADLAARELAHHFTFHRK